MQGGLALTVPVAAVGVAVLHTAAGPDHYLPFVALAHARGWSRARVLGVTAACGLAHVLASLVLGVGVVLLGASLGLLETIELGRATVAGWILVGFGAAYTAWGVWHARDGQHAHAHAHAHAHGKGGDATFWTLFIVFALGPCEPLIPLVFLPAAEGRWLLAVTTALAFGAATVITMVLLVGVACASTRSLPLGFLKRWAHGAAGLLLLLSGVALLLGP